MRSFSKISSYVQNKSSFLTFADILEFTNCQKAIKEAEGNRRSFVNRGENRKLKEGIKNIYPMKDSVGKIYARSFIRRVETELEISNDSKHYRAHFRIYLC